MDDKISSVKEADIRLISEDTLLVEFGDKFSTQTQNKVFALVDSLSNSAISNQIETLPTIRSVMIRFDPFTLPSEQLIKNIKALQSLPISLSVQQWQVSVCFEGRHAEDMEALSKRLHLSPRQITAKLQHTNLCVSMIGFAPGFTYLSGIDADLHISRRATPRTPMPQNSLMLGGEMASITSVSMPTGWYVVGQVPFDLFDIIRSKRTPFTVGDEIKIQSISESNYINYRALNQKDNEAFYGLKRIQDNVT